MEGGESGGEGGGREGSPTHLSVACSTERWVGLLNAYLY